MLSSSARPSKRPSSARYISESIIFKPRLTELLILCCVTVRSRQMQLQMPCLVVLWERPLHPHVSEPRSHVYEPHIFELASHSFEPCAFEPHVYEPHSPGFTIMSLALSALYTSSTLIPLHQILVCEILVLSHLCQCDAFRRELVGVSTKPTLEAWDWGCKNFRIKTIRAR